MRFVIGLLVASQLYVLGRILMAKEDFDVALEELRAEVTRIEGIGTRTDMTQAQEDEALSGVKDATARLKATGSPAEPTE